MSTSNRNGTGSSTGARPRILRIGILLGGKIVEERLIRDRSTVTIGQSVKNTFSVPLDGLPLEFPLFPAVDHQYKLNVLKGMDGRLSESGGGVQLLEQAKASAEHHGDYYTLPLSEHSRGKLTLGDLTILFQFVVEPPIQPKPMLPASVRGSIADRIDPRLSVILAISIISHFTIVLIAWRMDPEVDDGIAERAYNLTFKPETYNIEVEPPPQPQQNGTATEAAGKKDEAKPAKPEQPKSGGSGGPKNDGGGSSKGSGAAAAEEAIAFANALTVSGEGGVGGLGDMGRRAPGGDLSSEITEVNESGRTVGIGGGTGRGTRGDGDPRVGTGGGPRVDGPGGTTSAGGGKGEEKGPAGRISVSDKEGDVTNTLTPDEVLRKIQAAYMAGLKRCYKEHLKTDPTARGGVQLTFTVNETGRTVGGRAKGFASSVDTCITGLMSTWRFAVPKDKDDGEPAEASFSIKLQLVPD
ncbi:MAG: hypothetical protein IPI49_19970 [Myxococcales bacterium]|nr:hypothetical protein [Myxococcales bacterium]